MNTLCLFYTNGRGHELDETFDWVANILKNRAYTAGTYYYVGGDLFLFFLSHFLRSSAEVCQRLGPMFKERIQERFGVEADALSSAVRILAAAAVGIVDSQDFDTLLSMQCEDGSWGKCWFYRIPGTGIQVRNDGLTTALSIRAIKEVKNLAQTCGQTDQ